MWYALALADCLYTALYAFSAEVQFEKKKDLEIIFNVHELYTL